MIIITILATILEYVTDIPVVTYAFSGIRICVCILVLSAVINLWKSAVTSKIGIGIFIVVFLLSAVWEISPIIIVISAGIFGYVFRTVSDKRKEKESK